MLPEEASTDGRSDFDFIFGRWRIRNRRLVDLADPSCTEWVEFEARSQAGPILGGLGHVDRMWAESVPGEGPFEGFTLRLFEPGARIWRIWWSSSRRPGVLDPPVVGHWEAGRGRFQCEDTIAGRPVTVRFDWSHETPTTARWEQYFTYDGGTTWYRNWVMDLYRSQ